MRIRARRALATAAAGLTLAVPAVTALPAQAAVTGQCDLTHTCMNLWGGGFAISGYQGYAANNAISIQWLPNGYFQLRDNVHGGCVGDYGGSKSNARAGGGNTCNSTATGTGGDWGTVFQPVSETAICGGTYVKYWSRHWLAYVGFADGNGHPVLLNTRGNCLKQQAA